MSEVDMPPNMTGGGASKKKKKEKTAVHPIQQVQPQPHRLPSPDLSPLEDSDDKLTMNSKMMESQPRAVITVELEGVTRDTEKELFLDDFSPLIDTSIAANITNVSTRPIAPPRSGKAPTNSTSASYSPVPISPLAASPAARNTRERTPSITYIKGQLVKPADVPEASIASTVAELVHEAIPSQQTSQQAEKVEWVEFFVVEKAGECGRKMDVVLLGLVRGFQLWVATENGDMEEVMSERQGPIRAFVPIPNNVKLGGAKDAFAESRPMVALVDAFSHVPDRQFCTVSVVSLSSKKVIRLPSPTTAYEEPVCSLQATDRFLLVCLSSRAIVYDTLTLQEIRSIKVAAPMEGNSSAVAIYGQMIAFADLKLNVDVQSCGGMDMDGDETPSTYTSQVMNVAKAFSRTVTSLGESVSGNAGAKAREGPKGVVTVLDLAVEEKDDTKSSIVAHWAAHMEPLSMCAWSPDGRQLVTADVNGSCFNVFVLLPHSQSPLLGSVQHLYRLHRGNTAAKVMSTAFSLDCRWLAVATNHGTTHVFALCPYGGKPSMRTHGDHFTNKESKFLRTAGLVESDATFTTTGRARMHSGNMVVNREHPAQRNRMLAKCSGNPRIGPHPPAVLLTAVKKIRDPRISADNLSAWATDLTPLNLTNSSRKLRLADPPRMSLAFSSRASSASKPQTQSLLIARAETGIVFEYELRPRQPTSQGHSEDAPRLDVKPLTMWTLHRTKNNADIPLPLQSGSPLMVWATKDRHPSNNNESEKWIPQVEMYTCSGPARRLWQGPQFQFFVYKEDNSAELMTPSESRNSLSSMKSIPVVIGQKQSDRDEFSGEATRIECGSWVSQSSLNFPEGVDISQKIADAMKDIDFESTHHNSLDDFVDAPSPRASDRNSNDDEELLQFDDI